MVEGNESLDLSPHRRRVGPCNGHVVTRLGFEPRLGGYARRGSSRMQTSTSCSSSRPTHGPVDGACAEGLRRKLPIICASIYPDSPGAERLRPLAYLMKPFALVDLERALLTAVETTVARA